MTEDLEAFVGDPARTRWHRAWVVAAVTLGALVAAAAFRSSTGVLLEPIESEFGWSRATTSGAVSLNLVLYGITAPAGRVWRSGFGVPTVTYWSILSQVRWGNIDQLVDLVPGAVGQL